MDGMGHGRHGGGTWVVLLRWRIVAMRWDGGERGWGSYFSCEDNWSINDWLGVNDSSDFRKYYFDFSSPPLLIIMIYRMTLTFSMYVCMYVCMYTSITNSVIPLNQPLLAIALSIEYSNVILSHNIYLSSVLLLPTSLEPCLKLPSTYRHWLTFRVT